MDSSKYAIILLFVLNISCSNDNHIKTSSSGEGKNEAYLLSLTNPENTNLYFTNKVLETKGQNYLTYESMYNGSGVAVGVAKLI